MKDPIELEKEYNDWLRKGGDKINWVYRFISSEEDIYDRVYFFDYPDLYKMGKNFILDFYSKNGFRPSKNFIKFWVYRKEYPYSIYTCWDFDLIRHDIATKQEAEDYAQECYRSFMYKKITGKDLK